MDFRDLLINEDMPVLDAMKQLDKVGKKVLFWQQDGRLLASLTDGDIRRWIMKGGDLKATIRNVANFSPKYLNITEREKANEFMRTNSITAVPILSDDGLIEDVIVWNEKPVQSKGELSDIPVVMMAGGFGTRLYPYTKILPKALIPVGETPIAERIMDRFHSFGCKRFIMIVNHKKNMIKAYFNEIDKDYTIEFVDEDEPLGTGGGLSLLKGKVLSTFILTNCDILIDQDMSKVYKQHCSSNSLATMICSLKNFTIPYGVVNISDDGVIKSLDEKPTYSFFTNTGCYIVEPEVLNSIEDGISIGFPEVLTSCQKSGARIQVFPISEKSWHDMGQLDEYRRMEEHLLSKENDIYEQK